MRRVRDFALLLGVADLRSQLTAASLALYCRARGKQRPARRGHRKGCSKRLKTPRSRPALPYIRTMKNRNFWILLRHRWSAPSPRRRPPPRAVSSRRAAAAAAAARAAQRRRSRTTADVHRHPRRARARHRARTRRASPSRGYAERLPRSSRTSSRVQFDFLGEIKELEKLPVYVGVLMDTSSSTSGKLEFEKEAAQELPLHGHAHAQRPRRLRSPSTTRSSSGRTSRATSTCWTRPSTPSRSRARRPRSTTPSGSSATRRCAASAAARRALVVITDGDDTYSRARIEDAIAIAQKTDTIIFAISTKGGFTGSAVPGVEAGTVKDSGDKELVRSWPRRRAGAPSSPATCSRSNAPSRRSARSCARSTSSPTRHERPFDGSYRRIEVKVARPATATRSAPSAATRRTGT